MTLGKGSWKQVASALTLLFLFLPSVHAQTYHVFYKFKGKADGQAPNGPLVQDSAGNLYGTTALGGMYSSTVEGEGTIFKLDPSGNETILHVFSPFTPGPEGNAPGAGLYRDPAGNLYGTTSEGGTRSSGTVFKLDTANVLTTLYSFDGHAHGWSPNSRLISFDGQLYGTTNLGGAGSYPGCGVIFRISPTTGNLRVLYKFTGGTDGCHPNGVIADSEGNLYGSTNSSQISTNFGTVFKLDTAGILTVLYTFTGGADGSKPEGRVIRDVNGNIHGTTVAGGAGDCNGGCGVVYLVAADGTEFSHPLRGGGEPDEAQGVSPTGGLLDMAGSLIGTTQFGGGCTEVENGCGVIFEIDNTGHYKVLHHFTGVSIRDGSEPVGDPILGLDGSIYGSTEDGGNLCNCGMIYKYTP
jgi:uncharacterized repeat protein (TIGR03803 family)